MQQALVASGAAHGDATDSDAYQLAKRVVGDLQTTTHANDRDIRIERFECFTAGCIATMVVEAGVDYVAFENRLKGGSYGAPTLSWPGGRVFPPPIEGEHSRSYSVVFVRPDTTVGL